MAITRISVRGARQHNLKNVDVDIPRNTLTVITGLSGSGKSSLAFDTIYAEGQRRYVETLSAYARQFLDQMERPDVDAIDGLSPSISIEQKTTSRSPRSTVGTITEIYDYLRLLYASIGVPHCPQCGREISRQSVDQIVGRVMELKPEDRVMLLAPMVRGRKGEFKKELEKLAQAGFTRARIDGELRNIDDEVPLDKRKNHTIEIVVDRLLVKPGIEKRLANSVEIAMKLANGLVQVAVVDGEEHLYSSRLACPECGINVPQLEPRSFSFNSVYGACPECNGLGSKYDFDPAKVINDWSKPLFDGGLGPGSGSAYLKSIAYRFAEENGINLDKPFEQLTAEQQNAILYGPRTGGRRSGFRGILAFHKQTLEEATSETYREWLLQYMSATPCPVCGGRRLRAESLGVKVNGLSIADFTALPVARAVEAAAKIKLSAREEQLAGRIVREISERLGFLNHVGLGYISLDRSAATLSGGEGQRIRLATQIGSKLRGVLYVLDEPSIGLHARDNEKLLQSLEELRDLGNTVLVVEHDEETIRRSDYVIDLGPGAGKHGAAEYHLRGSHRDWPGRDPGGGGAGLPRCGTRPGSRRRDRYCPRRTVDSAARRGDFGPDDTVARGGRAGDPQDRADRHPGTGRAGALRRGHGRARAAQPRAGRGRTARAASGRRHAHRARGARRGRRRQTTHPGRRAAHYQADTHGDAPFRGACPARRSHLFPRGPGSPTNRIGTSATGAVAPWRLAAGSPGDPRVPA